MMRQRRLPKVGATRVNDNPVLSIVTDLIFISIAGYLLAGYAWTVFLKQESFLVLIREVFLAAYLMLALGFIIIRKRAMAFTIRKMDYVYTIIGFSAPLLLQPSPYGGPFSLGAALEVGGLAFVVSAFLSLNRSFGLAPQNRGIKTGGAYKLVRHPMYLGYILLEAGFVVDNVSVFNISVLAISILFLLLRLSAEEQLLAQDLAYRNYSKKTRWKLLPPFF